MTRFCSSKNMGRVVVKTDKDGKQKLVRVRPYGSVSAKLAAKRKRKWKASTGSVYRDLALLPPAKGK